MKAKKLPDSTWRVRRICAPTDFSDAARHALDLGVAWTAKLGGKISLVYVEPTPLPGDMTQLPALLEHEGRLKKAKQWLASLRDEAVPAACRGPMAVRSGSVYSEVLNAARGLKADLIVIGTHGYSGLTHALLGSVAERVVRHATIPVLTVRQARKSKGFQDPKRILVPLDFSAPSVRALGSAAGLARVFGARITLLHVLEPPNYPFFGYAHVPIQERRWRESARQQLEAFQSNMEKDRVAGTRIVSGRAFQGIVDEAKRLKADLIVIGTHGHTGLSRMLLGSTAERVVRHATCPVLTLRTV